MRKILILIALLASVIGYAQDTIIKPLEYSEVVRVENVSQDELYNRAKLFIVDLYLNAKEVIQLDDKEDGVIICKGIEHKKMDRVDNHIRYTLSIALKEGRYKYTISDIIHEGSYYSSQLKNVKHIDLGLLTTSTEPKPLPGTFRKSRMNYYNSIKAYVAEITTGLSSRIKQGMDKPSISKTEEW